MVKRVLIINPNVQDIEKIKLQMTSSNAIVHCASTADEALEHLNHEEFCLVILDASFSASDDHNILKAMSKAPYLYCPLTQTTANDLMLCRREHTSIWDNHIPKMNVLCRHTP